MTRRRSALALAVLMVCARPVLAQQPPVFLISCEGTESGGGGVTNYEYMLLNNTAAPLLVTVLEVATNDPNLAAYTNVTAPAGFGFKLTPNTAYWMSNTKAAHGALSAGPIFTPPRYAEWSNPVGVMLNPGQALGPFGFNHPWKSADAEWGAFTMGGAQFTIGNWQVPVAGPIGIYTSGPVHAPFIVPEPCSILLIVAGLLLLSRRPA